MADKGIVIQGTFEDGGLQAGLDKLGKTLADLGVKIDETAAKTDADATALAELKTKAAEAAAALERIRDATASTAERIGQSAPQIRNLKDEYDRLAAEVASGSITQAESAARYEVAVREQREAIKRLIADLDKLDVSHDKTRVAAEQQRAALLRLDAALDQVQAEGLTRINAQAGRSAQIFANLGRRVLALVGAYAALNAAQRALAAARTQELAERRLLVALGEEQAFRQREILDLASELQREGIFGDEDLLLGAVALRNAGVAAEDVADRLRVVNDTAAATGVSIEQVARGIGLFAQGTAGELGERIPELRALAKEGRLAGEGVDFLRQRFGGAAREIADTDLGRMTKAANDFSDAIEQIGFVIAGLASRPTSALATFVKDAADNIREAERAIRETFGEGGPSLEDRITALGEAARSLAGKPAEEVAAFARRFEVLKDELRDAIDAQESLNATTRENVGFPNEARLERKIDELRALQRVLVEARAALTNAENVPAIGLTVRPGDDQSALDRITKDLARLAAQVGRDAPTIRSLGDVFGELSAKVDDGSLSIAQATFEFSAAVANQRTEIDETIAALEALTLAQDDDAKARDEAVAGLRTMRDALDQLAQEGFVGLRSQTERATTAMEGFTAGFRQTVEAGANLAAVGYDLGAALADGLAQAAAAFAQGKKSFSEFAASFLAQISAMILRALVFQAISQALGFGGSTPGSTFIGPPPPAGGDFIGPPAPGLYDGGVFTGSGAVPGPDVGHDNVNAHLAGGEHVQPSHVVRYYGVGALEAIRAKAIPPSLLRAYAAGPSAASRALGFHSGGHVGPRSTRRGRGGATVAYVTNDAQQADRLMAGELGRQVEERAHRAREQS